jgi:hypothetical protein
MSSGNSIPDWHVVLGWIGAIAKFVAKALAFSLALLLFALIVFGGHLVDDIYKNVDDRDDGEMPTTVTSYPSGPEVVGIIGGSGKGLNCSLPPGLDVLFDGSPDAEGRRHLVRQRFRQACVAHDLCYRHGLATYGYSQNDCDRILQNQAFRLCKYIRNENRTSDSERCQQDSKMILAGVSIGGSGSYRAWDRSTYFEYDSHPLRSNGFSVSRVVDHPFKSVDPAKYRDEAQQVILTFTNKHFDLTVRCATCKEKTILDASEHPQNVSNELRSVNIQRRPEALVGRELSLTGTNPIWLPPRRGHAAPQLLVDGTGKHHLIWMSRISVENTISCIVWADAAKLLIYTLPKSDVCRIGSGSTLTMVQPDMWASSPLPLELPGAGRPDHILATGLSPQRDPNFSLSLCMWSERIRAKGAETGDDHAVCTLLRDSKIAAGNGLGAFQNFAVVRPGQEIFFARDVALPRASNWLAGFFERIGGNIYSKNGSIVVVDVGAPTKPEDGPGVVAIKKISRFAIDDRFDPMMPMTRTKDDLRFLSLLASKGRLGVYLTDFEKDAVPHEVGLTVAGARLDLHSSWGDRPVLVLETKEPSPKTKLVLSRGHLVPDPRVDTVRLETLVLERDALAPEDNPFSVTSAATCTVKYHFKRINPHSACLRAFDPGRPMRPSPAPMMRASQLLVGRFGGADGLSLAFVDLCPGQRPIILVSRPDGTFDFTATARVAEDQARMAEDEPLRREVNCSPLDARDSLGRAMVTNGAS